MYIHSVDSCRHFHCASTHIFRVSFFGSNILLFYFFVNNPRVSELWSDEILRKVLCLDRVMGLWLTDWWAFFHLSNWPPWKCFHLNIIARELNCVIDSKGSGEKESNKFWLKPKSINLWGACASRILLDGCCGCSHLAFAICSGMLLFVAAKFRFLNA